MPFKFESVQQSKLMTGRVLARYWNVWPWTRHEKLTYMQGVGKNSMFQPRSDPREKWLKCTLGSKQRVERSYGCGSCTKAAWPSTSRSTICGFCQINTWVMMNITNSWHKEKKSLVAIKRTSLILNNFLLIRWLIMRICYVFQMTF